MNLVRALWRSYKRWFAWMETRPGPSVHRTKDRPTKGGYKSSERLVSSLKPPLPGPAPGMRRSTGDLGPGVGPVHPNCPTCKCKPIDPTGRI